MEGINRGELDIELYLNQELGSSFKTWETADSVEKRIRIKDG